MFTRLVGNYTCFCNAFEIIAIVVFTKYLGCKIVSKFIHTLIYSYDN